MQTINKLNGNILSSNTIFSALKYKFICQVNKDWLLSVLYQVYGKFDHLANKYVFICDGRLYTRQDDIIWLIEDRNEVKQLNIHTNIGNIQM